MTHFKNWKPLALGLAQTGEISWRDIAATLNVPKSTVSDYLRQHMHEPKVPEEAYVEPAWGGVEEPGKHDNSRILFISDMHTPYQHENTVEFLSHLKKKYQPTRIICLGDCVDHHALSYHDSDPDLDSSGTELCKARAVLKQVEALFPVMDIVHSNHGSLVWRKAKTHGISRHYIKPYNEVIGVGPGWKWHPDITLQLPDGQNVYVHHGKTADAIKVSQTMGMSFVCGHFHEKFGINYWANPLGLYFAMNCGCLIDDKSLAFSYNNVNLKRPIIGTGLIIDGKPVLEAMPL